MNPDQSAAQRLQTIARDLDEWTKVFPDVQLASTRVAQLMLWHNRLDPEIRGRLARNEPIAQQVESLTSLFEDYVSALKDFAAHCQSAAVIAEKISYKLNQK